MMNATKKETIFLPHAQMVENLTRNGHNLTHAQRHEPSMLRDYILATGTTDHLKYVYQVHPAFLGGAK